MLNLVVHSFAGTGLIDRGGKTTIQTQDYEIVACAILRLT